MCHMPVGHIQIKLRNKRNEWINLHIEWGYNGGGVRINSRNSMPSSFSLIMYIGVAKVS